MESINKVEYNVRNLSTRSVTLFPTRAQVFRDVKDVPLHPGTNEITILGLSPTVDEDSIKVDGSGAATISNIAVESIPNRENYEDIYPDYYDSLSEDDEDDEIEAPEFPESAELKGARTSKQQALRAVKSAQEDIDNANDRRSALWEYNRTLTSKNVKDLGKSISSYKEYREATWKDVLDGEARLEEANKALDKCSDKVRRLEKEHERGHAQALKEHRRAVRARDKAREAKLRRKEERRAEKQRVKQEREKFWPKYCYAVRIQLDATNFATPTSSRRDSLVSDVELVNEKVDLTSNAAAHDGGKTDNAGGVTTCDLVLSYVTTAASWSPSYDLQLSTNNATGTLCFDAQLENTTSETWEKCQITLSTSQTSSTTLDETVPVLIPWRTHLGSARGITGDGKGMTFSREERGQRQARLKSLQQQGKQSGRREDMFGFDISNTRSAKNTTNEASDEQMEWNKASQDYQMQLMLLEQQNKKRLMMARQEEDQREEKLKIRKSRAQDQAQQQQQMQQQQMPTNPHVQQALQSQRQQAMQQLTQQPQVPASGQAGQDSGMDQIDFSDASSDGEAEEQGEKKQQLDFEESLVEESGFTTSYDLPNLKTLAPRSTTSKQRIARVHFTNVIFNYTVVAKYKPVAHLSAKLQNTSKISLLRGPVGVTLDGSFMGRTTLPRCASGGEYISLSLGVDPAIRVAYATPTMQRASVGFFTKEDIMVYDRCITLENTRTTGGKHVKLLVRDQIPVSNDERLRVELHQPKELTPDGESKPAGEPAGVRDQDGWGTADSRLKKNGEVTWLVALRPGRSVKLPLQYIVATPIGDCAVEDTNGSGWFGSN